MPRVFASRRFPDRVRAELERSFDLDLHDSEWPPGRDELLHRVAGCDGLMLMLTDRVDDELLDAVGDQLVIMANYAVGFDNIDVRACTARGVLASNTPDVLTETTADLTWALMMAAARRVAEGDRFLRRREPWIWAPEMMLGQDLHHKTLGIVGFGRIGHAMARRARGFGMKVLYFDVYRPGPELEEELGAEYRELDDLLRESDLVTLHVNLSDDTRHLIDEERPRAMKPTAVLVNTSRGPVIDEEALADALASGGIFAAGLDVFEREPDVHQRLLDAENAVVIPHLGSATVETRAAMGMLAVDNVLAALEGREPPTLIDRSAWPGRAQSRIP